MRKTAVLLLALAAVLALPSTGTAQAPQELFGFFAYSPLFTGGVDVATCGPDPQGVMWIITSAGPGGGPHVAAYAFDLSSNFIQRFSFFAYNPFFTGGVHVSCAIDAVARVPLLLTAPQGGGGPHVRVWLLR